jgi:hypothetical protein
VKLLTICKLNLALQLAHVHIHMDIQCKPVLDGTLKDAML